MTEDEARRMFVEEARFLIDTPYLWGGRDQGVDCSGLVAVTWNRLSHAVKGGADRSFYAHYTDSLWRSLPVEPAPWTRGPQPGALVFWRARHAKFQDDMEHVEICTGNEWETIGAIGGDSSVRRLEDALRHRAKVRIRSDLRERSGVVAGYRTMPWHLLGIE